ncbi:MAG: acetolactate synthase small subunit [Chloroflexi bacterium]|nr:acetolactate synthase small subunit [Chloroflexota bacterium]
MATMKHTLTMLVEDKPGLLNRVTSMIRRRNFNIDSIAVGAAAIEGYARMVLVVDGATTAVDQVRKQLDKIIGVVKITDITESNVVARELALVKVNSSPETRSEIIQLTDIFRASILDVTPDSMIIEVTGDDDKVNAMIELLKGFGVSEVARTGRVAMARGALGPLKKPGHESPKPKKTRKAASAPKEE